MKTFGARKMNTAYEVIEVRFDFEDDENSKYLEIKVMYKKFWFEHQEIIVLKVDTKYKISID
jgi:hypothetical protein